MTGDHRELELTLIGMAMKDMGIANQIAALPDDVWMFEDTKRFVKAIRELVSKNEIADLITITNIIGTENDDVVNLMQASQLGFTTVGYKQMETMLVDHWRRRTIRNACETAAQRVMDMGVSPDDVAAGLEKAMQTGYTDTDDVDMKNAVYDLMQTIDESKGKRLMTGIGNLDMIVGGFQPGQLIFIGARPGVGKTALALFIACKVATSGKRVLFSSLEMTASEIAARLSSADSGVNLQNIANGDLTEQDNMKLMQSLPPLSRLNMVINNRLYTPLRLRQKVSNMVNSEEGLGLVIVDYIQLMEADEKSGSRYEAVSQISRRLKQIAMDNKVPIIALTQFNRASEAGEGRTKKRRPTMAEAKDSGSIEQDANVFITQYAPDEPDQGFLREAYLTCQNQGKELQILTVEKNRQGKTGQTAVCFDKAHMRFTSIINDTGMRW